MMTTTARRTWEGFQDSSKFFADATDKVTGDDITIMIRLTKSCVVVSIPLANGKVDKVAFMKTSRSKMYRDSRGKRTEKKDEWGNKVVGIAPLMISEAEVKAELLRLLEDSYEAEMAFRALW